MKQTFWKLQRFTKKLNFSTRFHLDILGIDKLQNYSFIEIMWNSEDVALSSYRLKFSLKDVL